jgi:5-methylthioadenosine/S-adenosylhomocysteine deaminase
MWTAATKPEDGTMADILIKGAYVVTMDPSRRILSNGAIAIAGDRIVAVGASDEVATAHPAPLVIDGSDMMALPGLVDGHHHPNQYLSNGIGDDVDIMTLLYKRLYPYEAALTPEEAYHGALGGFAEAIRNGTTCFNDPGGHNEHSSAQAAVDIGIRGLINRSTRDIYEDQTPVPESQQEDTETAMRRGEELVKKWNGSGDGRLRGWFGLRYIFNVSDDLCQGIKALADQYDAGIHIHVAAVKGENEAIQEIFGKRSLERLYDLGLFDRNLYTVHMGYPDEREIGLMAEHDVKVAHCPGASMLGAYGVIANRMMPRMAEAGICISLGTDSATASGNLDMVRVMYLGACAHKDAYADATMWGAYKALEMATIDGARSALWEDEIGSLEPGKKADVILVDMSAPEFSHHPGRQPVHALVYSGTGRNVDTSIINGKLVMRHGMILTIDEENLANELAEASRAWRSRIDLEVPVPWPVT